MRKAIPMSVCPYCGKENNQPDAAYCLYCGSSLRGQQARQPLAMSPGPTSGQGYSTSGGIPGATPEASERYERALARVEQLANIVVILAVATLVLVLI